MSEPKSTSLFYRDGGSDKVYQAQLLERADGWAVTFQYGRRGKALTEGEKCAGLSYSKAAGIYEKLVQSKTSKGYTPSEDGLVFSSPELAGRVTGFQPQLLNEITHEEAMLLGDDWLFQEKHDGDRMGLIADAGGARFSNRKGLEIGAVDLVASAFQRMHEIIGGDLTLDGENMGSHVVIFDVPKHFMIQNGTFRERAAILENLRKNIQNEGLDGILVVDVPVKASEFFAKHEARLRAAGSEGYVARHQDSLYTPGRPNSGGSALKVKNWADITCRVTEGREGKSSVGIELMDDAENWVGVGNVTIPQSVTKPEIGSLIDVRYLYAYPGGSIYQPTFERVRTDIDPGECRIDRLKMKAEPAAEGPSL